VDPPSLVPSAVRRLSNEPSRADPVRLV